MTNANEDHEPLDADEWDALREAVAQLADGTKRNPMLIPVVRLVPRLMNSITLVRGACEAVDLSEARGMLMTGSESQVRVVGYEMAREVDRLRRLICTLGASE